MTRRDVRWLVLVCAWVAVCTAACGKPAEPPAVAPVPKGPIKIDVDATDVARKLYHVRLAIPAVPGPLTLVYPKWLPGEHAPTGPVTDMVGFRVAANGASLAWQRDPVDMYAFHVTVPAGAGAVDVTFDFLSAGTTSGFSSAASATPHLAIVTWNQLLVYPEGVLTDHQEVESTLKLPPSWQFGTALQSTSSTAGLVTFAKVSLTDFVDSPVLAGEFFKSVPLDSSSRPIVLDMAADSAASLAIGPELTETLKRLVAEADALFGARHFDRYHFLLTLSDHVAHFGLEHHQSNDSRVYEKAVLDKSPVLGVLSHEFVHSWNGKYRRPAGLATTDFQQPMRGDLLWVYEGLTQYLGTLLAARSGIWTDHYYRERLAMVAAYLDGEPGRQWRPLADTAVAAQLLYAAPAQWAAYRRSTDFYDEGWLLWLDADTKIRELSNNQRSLDDFCRHFHGGVSSSASVKPYTFDDVVAALNEVVAFDWRAFLNDRVTAVATRAPLDGLGRAGWQLGFSDVRNEYLTQIETGEWKRTDASVSLGLQIAVDGEIIDVIPGLAAGGLAPGMKVVTVAGRKWAPDVFRAALIASAKSTAPLALQVDNQGVTLPVLLDYHGGLRDPHLTRLDAAMDRLKDLIAPRAGSR